MLEAPKICKYIQNVKFIKLKLEKQSRNDLKIRQITKMSKLLLSFPRCKMIQIYHFCWGSSIHNQMLHNIGQKKYNWDHQKWHFNVFIDQNFWDNHFWTRCTTTILIIIISSSLNKYIFLPFVFLNDDNCLFWRQSWVELLCKLPVDFLEL